VPPCQIVLETCLIRAGTAGTIPAPVFGVRVIAMNAINLTPEEREQIIAVYEKTGALASVVSKIRKAVAL